MVAQLFKHGFSLSFMFRTPSRTSWLLLHKSAPQQQPLNITNFASRNQIHIRTLFDYGPPDNLDDILSTLFDPGPSSNSCWGNDGVRSSLSRSAKNYLSPITLTKKIKFCSFLSSNSSLCNGLVGSGAVSYKLLFYFM